MLRWTRAWRVSRGAPRPVPPRCSPVPVALCSSGGGGDAEPRHPSLPLSYKLLGGEATLPAIVFLHGLFGSKTNFSSIAKALAQQTGRRLEIPGTVFLAFSGIATYPESLLSPAVVTPEIPRGRLRQEDWEFEISLGYLSRSCLKNKEPGMVAQAFNPSNGEAEVLTVDARNHGDSPHSPDASYEAMSQDLQDLLPQLGLVPCVLVGHSMGGKTAMLLALQKPEVVERLIAVDISPVVTTSVSNFANYMAAMKAIDIPEKVPRSRARKLADEQLSSVIQDPAVRQFLLTNLVEVDGRFSWRVNLDTLAQHMDKIMAFPKRTESYSGPTLFLLGGNSAFVQPSHHPEIKRLFPRAQMQTVPNAGHWVHADSPQDFMAAIRGFLA